MFVAVACRIDLICAGVRFGVASSIRAITPLDPFPDLTRQYLLQIIAEHEAKGESVLPITVLTDLVRTYTTGMQSVVPTFLQASFEMLRDGQSKMMENLAALPNPLAAMPGFEAMRKSQEAIMKTMMAGLPAWSAPAAKADAPKDDDIAQIKKQLADLQAKLSRL